MHVFWPNMTSELKSLIDQRLHCQLNMPNHPREPLRPTESPAYSFQMVAVNWLLWGEDPQLPGLCENYQHFCVNYQHFCVNYQHFKNSSFDTQGHTGTPGYRSYRFAEYHLVFFLCRKLQQNNCTRWCTSNFASKITLFLTLLWRNLALSNDKDLRPDFANIYLDIKSLFKYLPTVQLGLAGRAGGSSCLAMAMRATGGYTNRLTIIKKGLPNFSNFLICPCPALCQWLFSKCQYI